MVYVTRSLVEVLLDFAADADPQSVTADIAVRPAGDLEGAEDIDPETPVFAEFYLPDTGKSVRAVFGMDLSTPVGQTQGRFVSHPMGDLSVSRTDDLHEAVLVAVPPWGSTDLAAFDRSGRRLELDLIDAVPPDEPFVELD